MLGSERSIALINHGEYNKMWIILYDWILNLRLAVTVMGRAKKPGPEPGLSECLLRSQTRLRPK